MLRVCCDFKSMIRLSEYVTILWVCYVLYLLLLWRDKWHVMNNVDLYSTTNDMSRTTLTFYGTTNGMSRTMSILYGTKNGMSRTTPIVMAQKMACHEQHRFVMAQKFACREIAPILYYCICYYIYIYIHSL